MRHNSKYLFIIDKEDLIHTVLIRVKVNLQIIDEDKISIVSIHVIIYDTILHGPAVCKRGNRVPWSAPVARVNPRTADHRKIPLRVRVRPDHEHGYVIGRLDMERGPNSV